VARVYRYSTAALIWRVLLPSVLPTYLIGLRSGLALGWMFVVAAELMGASQGLGYLLVDGQQTAPEPRRAALPRLEGGGAARAPRHRRLWPQRDFRAIVARGRGLAIRRRR